MARLAKDIEESSKQLIYSKGFSRMPVLGHRTRCISIFFRKNGARRESIYLASKSIRSGKVQSTQELAMSLKGSHCIRPKD